MGQCCPGKSGGAELAGRGEDVLFFPDEKLPCRFFKTTQGCRRQKCDFSHTPTSLSRLLEYLDQARTSLDICVFTITSDDIANAVLAAHQRGVKIRVLTDNDQMASLGSDIGKFKEAGLQVRDDRSPAHMHHKFCIIDGRLLLNGSFNWTRQAVTANRENVVISDSPKLVRAFTEEFNRMWQLYHCNT